MQGQRVTVMGLGQFGGGLGVTKWLIAQGAHVTLTDADQADKLEQPLAELKPHCGAVSGTLRLALGGHHEPDFTNADVVVVNPAVRAPWTNPFVAAAQRAGATVTSEIVLTCERIPAGVRTVAITGSVGKSTTSAMIAHAARDAAEPGRRVVFGGNIGGSILDDVTALATGDVLVLELSSAMLHWLAPIAFAPDVAVITNFSPNHLDWHGEVDHYRRSKQNLLAFLRPGATAVLGVGEVAEWPTPAGVRRAIIPAHSGIDGMLIPGRHNRWNAAVAVASLNALGLDPSREARVIDSLRRFPGLEHRLRRVGVTERGVVAFNDSKSTTPESTLTAVEAFADDPGLSNVHLIAGGYDKGADLGAVASLAPRLAGLYTLAQTGPAIAAAARNSLGADQRDQGSGRVFECGTLDGAVAAALERARPGSVLLLSPACASWGQYQNFERRGEHFVELLRTRGLKELA